jgi:hypothetical protein
MAPIQQGSNLTTYGLFLCLFLLIPIASIHGQTQPEVAPPAKTDTYAVTVDGKKLRIQNREVAETNFRISGVDLASSEEVLLQATKLFGKSPSVSSGDASTSNTEVCYRSASENDNTHLIFGQGEVNSLFILSSDSSVWKGNDICKRSEKIARNVATDSGLHLGLTQEQVIAILGLATRRNQNIPQRKDVLIYSLEAKKHTDPQKLARMWEQEIKKTPADNRKVFLENYALYSLEVYIDARFVNDSLTRLTVSWSAQY